jgi:hypothetical protein
MRYALFVLLSLCLAESTFGRDIFVDNRNGDDRRNGSTPTSEGAFTGPVRTIAKAVRLCSGGGDRIILINSGEPYREAAASLNFLSSSWAMATCSTVGCRSSALPGSIIAATSFASGRGT